MKRRPIHLAATIAELLRFGALIMLVQSLGLFRVSNGALRLLRYAAAPQLIFAAGFFFLWFDRERYKAYRPLLMLGKIVSLAALLPVAVLVGDYLRAEPGMMSSPGAAMVYLGLIVLVDLGALAVLVLSGESVERGHPREPAPPLEPGQGPADIEKVEG